MPRKSITQMNIGKNGLTEGSITWLKTAFKDRENIKVVVLKSGGHDKKKIEEMGNEIVSKLGKDYTYRIIGFTINLKKWRKRDKIPARFKDQ